MVVANCNSFQSGRGSSSSNQKTSRGHRHGNVSQTNRLVCQVCHKLGHMTLKCYHRFDNSFSVDLSSNMHALLTTPQKAPDLNCYSDSRATHHLIADLANLDVKADEYHSPDQIHIGNGLGLTVKHIVSTHLSTPTFSFLLNDVLHVPYITKNLIYVHKFTTDTNTLIEFNPTHFIVKDRTIGKVLLCRLSKDGLYLFPSTFNKIPLSSFAFVGERTSPNQWHSHLGHPAFRVVCHVLSRFSLPFSSNKNVHSCSACFNSKSKQLPFTLSCTQLKWFNLIGVENIALYITFCKIVASLTAFLALTPINKLVLLSVSIVML